jgi:hypothetical protein
MVKWELTAKYVDIGIYGGSNPSKLWSEKNKSTGLTAWDDLISRASKGWELVSVTPLGVFHGETKYLLYTFKRPIVEDVEI